MKPQAIFPAIVCAAAAALSFGVHAEDTAPAPKKMMKFHPHSHLVAKPKAADAAAEENLKASEAPPKEEKGPPNALKDTKHFHPRDGGK